MKKKLLILLIIPLLVTGCVKDLPGKEKTTREEDVLVVTVEPGKSVSRTSSKKTQTTDDFNTLPPGKTTKKTTTSTADDFGTLPTGKTTKTTKKTTTTSKKTSSTKKTTTQKLTGKQKEVYDKLMALKKKYPNGTSWGPDKEYYFQASNKKGRVGYSCAAFAYLISDQIFGTAPVTEIRDFKNYTIKVGDIIRLQDDKHTAIVIGNSNGMLTLAEGNATVDGKGPMVYWGRQISATDYKGWTYIWTRY